MFKVSKLFNVHGLESIYVSNVFFIVIRNKLGQSIGLKVFNVQPFNAKYFRLGISNVLVLKLVNLQKFISKLISAFEFVARSIMVIGLLSRIRCLKSLKRCCELLYVSSVVFDKYKNFNLFTSSGR